VANVDSEETTQPVEVLAPLCVVDIGAFATINYGQTVSLNACKSSEVAPEVTLSEVFNLLKVGRVHR
jgi:hypothetical protein